MKQWADGIGNSVFITGGKAFLKLKGEKPKMAGFISPMNSRVMVMERSEAKHMLQRIKGYGFNDKLLREYLIPNGLLIGLHIDKQIKYLLDPKMILEIGSYLHFKSQGYELQIFIALSDIEIIAMGRWETPLEQQKTMFDE